MICAPFPRFLPVLLVCALSVGCGPTARGTGSTTAIEEREVDEGSFDDVRRLYLVLAPDDPRREPVRRRLLGHLSARSESILAQRDYVAAVAHLADMTSLLSPAELREGSTVSEAFAPVARFVVEVGSPRGDEGRVLAALLLLSRIEPDGPHAAEYTRLATWGRTARWGAEGVVVGSDFFEIGPGLLDVWEEHSRLTAAPEVLDNLASLYTDLRDALEAQTSRAFEAPVRLSLQEMRIAPLLAARAPLDIAAVYLRVGDIETAIERVRALGDHGGIEFRLRRLLEIAAGENHESAEALAELAAGFERDRPNVSEALCRRGARVHPDDPSFPLCLARLASEMGRPGEAVAWYADAVMLAPGERDVYDEAIGRLALLLEDGMVTQRPDIGQARLIGRHAARILEERTRRWPDEAPTVTMDALDIQLAHAELRGGNVEAARVHLEHSLTVRRSSEAMRELAQLLARSGSPERAVPLYREALERIAQQSREGAMARAALQEGLGDALRALGRADEARSAYGAALEALTPLVDEEELPAAGAAMLRARVGALARRMGSRDQSDTAFRAAITQAPGRREPYVLIMSNLVVSEPDAGLAAEVFRAARTDLALEREWRVYLALWTQATAARTSTAVSDDVTRVLREQAEEPGWSGRLAAFGSGTLAYEGLLAAATDPGQRCEAHFYGGAALLATGDAAGAQALFQRAIETGMIDYFEFSMALDLLRTMR